METNEVIRLGCADVNFIATEVVLFGKLGGNEVFIYVNSDNLCSGK
jgi:hypothetical protein